MSSRMSVVAWIVSLSLCVTNLNPVAGFVPRQQHRRRPAERKRCVAPNRLDLSSSSPQWPSSSFFSTSPHQLLSDLQSFRSGEASEVEMEVEDVEEEVEEREDVTDEVISVIDEGPYSDGGGMTDAADEDITVCYARADTDHDEAATSLVSFASKNGRVVSDDQGDNEVDDLSETDHTFRARDTMYMQMAVDLAQSAGGERGPASAYPNPTTGALLVASDGRVLGRGMSSFARNAVHAVLDDAGLTMTPLREWCVTWPSSSQLRSDLAQATLYLTLEPDAQRRGQAHPPMTQLIELSGVQRVVIGAASPIPEEATRGAQALHQAGLDVSMGAAALDEGCVEACLDLIDLYTERATSKLQQMARKHRQLFSRPLGFLHCSVVDSDDIEAFAQHGNAFGKNFGGKTLSFRDFGSYEIAPPPEQIWADDQEDVDFYDDDDDDDDDDDGGVSTMTALDFEDEDEQEAMGGTPVMPWYEQVDAVIATFPRAGNGPMDENDSVMSRLNGLKWLATFGVELPAGVERILVMDATDLEDLPLTNDDPNLPEGVDIESFWAGEGRRPTRVLLRRGRSQQAEAAARAAAQAAEAAARAAEAAMEAIETGDAEIAAEAAIAAQRDSLAAAELIQKELSKVLSRKQKLQTAGVIVETLNGSEPIDVMKHLGQRNGYDSVVWRAGCWGQRGVKSILDGAFQWVSAHLAVDANGGKFWQQMLAERAVQGACGPESRVKVFAGEGDISLEYCDTPEADGDCVLTVDGKAVRHVRLDCRVALVDNDRPREFVIAPTKRLDRKVIEEEAPWFL